MRRSRGQKGHESASLWTEKWLTEAPGAGNSYGFGAGTKCLCLSLRAPITANFQGQLTQDSVLDLLLTVFVGLTPCPALLTSEKEHEHQSPARQWLIPPFSSFLSSLHPDTLYFNLVAGYLFSCPWVLNAWTLEDKGAGSS